MSEEASGEIEWLDDDHHGGSVIIEPTGIVVYTECCGCNSTELTDRGKLRALRDAIDLILSHPDEKVSP
jgi:hypothetical protein